MLHEIVLAFCAIICSILLFKWVWDFFEDIW